MPDQLEILFTKYVNGTATAAENREFLRLWTDPAHQSARERLLDNAWDQVPVDHHLTNEQADQLFNKIIPAPALIVPMKNPRRKTWLVAAASVVVLCLALLLFNLTQQRTDKPPTYTAAVKTDVAAPGTNRAMITLADGSQVFLDSAANGSLAQLGGVQLVKMGNGKIGYRLASGQRSGDVVAGGALAGGATQTNTLTNPRGSQVIDMTLSDGSRVWLNAGSSITYPVAFTGNERKVQISGEGYFEISHDASRPFIVTNHDFAVQVLGTHFNVNAYEDEDMPRVTLLQGSVKVSRQSATVILKPGQQAQLSAGIKVLDDVDVEGVTGWKNGLFHFDNASLGQVMKQLTRWYDVDVVYETKPPAREFIGDLERTLSLQQVLKLLEKNDIHFRVEGKKIIVVR